jgi:hypothetical protein
VGRPPRPDGGRGRSPRHDVANRRIIAGSRYRPEYFPARPALHFAEPPRCAAGSPLAPAQTAA